MALYQYLKRMPRAGALCLCVALWVGAADPAAGDPDPRFDGIVAALAGEDAAARDAVLAQAVALAPAAIDAIAPLLDYADPAVRATAREAISRVAAGAAAQPESRILAGRALLSALEGASNPAWLVEVIGRHGGPEHIDALLDLLDSHPELRPQTIDAIAKIGVVLPDSGAAIPRSTGPLRWLARQLGLADRPDPAPRALVAAALAVRVEGADATERAALVDALGALGEAVATPVLTPLLAEEPSAGVVAALGAIGDARACEALADHYAAHGGAHNLSAYTRALDQQPPTLATRGFVKLLGDDNPGAQAVGIRGIARHGTSTHFVERIAPFLVSDTPAVREAAAEAILAFEGDSFDRALVRVLRRAPAAQKAPLLPLLAARAPGLARAEATLLRAHDDPAVRGAALAVLGEAAP